MFTIKSFSRLFSVLLVVVSLLALVGTARASTSSVTNANNAGTGSLRQEIIDAGDGDTITFNASLAGQTILLSSELLIDKDLTIDGSSLGTHIQISGQDTVRVFNIGTGVTAEIKDLDIIHGYASDYGGGIYNNGTLNITNSTFSGNNADDGSENGDGGGIENFSIMTVTNSTFSNNGAGYAGGAIDNGIGTSTVTNSTFSSNSAEEGGGIANWDALTVTNSTFSGNSATSDGSGIENIMGSMYLYNTILSNGLLSEDCYNYDDLGATIAGSSNNLIEINGSGAYACGTPALTSDPNLGSLANNGGSTQTFALLTGSPAIDAGDNAICAAAPVSNASQNGVTRPQGLYCDVGSFEAITNPNPVVANIVRASANPSSAASVDFTVTFSKSVSGVDTGDFNLTTDLTGASVTSV